MSFMKLASGIAAATTFAIAASATPAMASAAIYNYAGQPMDCVGFQSSCVVRVTNPLSFTGSFTLPQDFNSNYSGDQTYYAFRFGFHFITDWSITDGVHTLGSATGDILDPNSSLTYNNGVIRTWNIAANNPGGSIVFNVAPHADYTSIGGAIVVGRALGSWSTGTGAPIGVVPEPATWALMLLGFAAVGSALRDRKATARVATVHD